MLAALVGGRAESNDLVALRPHLRHCAACRAEVRNLHNLGRPQVAALLPWPFFERLRPGHWKAELYGLFSRLGSADPAAGSLAAGGGGRGMGATAPIGLCLAGAGAGGYCVATGTLPDPAATIEAKTSASVTPPLREAAPDRLVAAAAPQAGRSPAATHSPRKSPQARRSSTPAHPRIRATRNHQPASSQEFSFEAATAPTPTPTATQTSPSTTSASTHTTQEPSTTPDSSADSSQEFAFER